MGVVYRARDPEVGREVAIKTLLGIHGNPDAMKRFRVEARAAGALRHNNIVTIFEANLEVSEPYLVMEFVAGESLQSLLARQGRLSPTFAMRYLQQLADAIDYAHDQGVVHHDIKPANVLIDQFGKPYLVDFGIANASVRITGAANKLDAVQRMGSIGYAAPEVIEGGTIGKACDLFSFGVVAYEMLTGRRPFEGATFHQIAERTVKGIRSSAADETNELPGRVDAVFDKIFAREASARFRTAGEFLAALESALKDEAPTGDDPISFGPRDGSTVQIQFDAEKVEQLRRDPHSSDSIGSSPWSGRSTSEVVQSLWRTRANRRRNPGAMFEHVQDSFVSGASSAPAKRGIRQWMPLVVGGAFLVSLLGYLVLGAHTEPPAPAEPPMVAPVRNDSLTLPAIEIAPPNVRMNDLTERELLGLIVRSEVAPDVAVRAIEEGQRRTVPQLPEALTVALQSPHAEVRRAAAHAAGERGDRRILPVLSVLLEDPHLEVRRAAASAMLQVGDRSIEGYLRLRYQSEDDEQVRSALRAALEKITGLPVSAQ